MSFLNKYDCFLPYDEDCCYFMLWGPNERNPIENQAFSCYAINAQTFENIAKAFIAEIALGVDINDIDTQREICDAYGVDFNNLTDFEIDYLRMEIERRLR